MDTDAVTVVRYTFVLEQWDRQGYASVNSNLQTSNVSPVNLAVDPFDAVRAREIRTVRPVEMASSILISLLSL